MAAVLVVFESKYGQSSKIAEHIGEAARDRGHAARVVHVEDLGNTDVTQYDAVAVVAAVYMSKHPRSVTAFVRAHARDLAACRRSAFFSVSNSAASRDPVVQKQARSLAEALPARLGWRPHVVALTGGAIAYPRYGFLTRFIMRRIARSNGGPTDLSRVHELTDWAKLDDDVAALVGPLETSAEPPLDAQPSA
jgi:menaquinone-dependent protoporphyrinogen oxidase